MIRKIILNGVRAGSTKLLRKSISDLQITIKLFSGKTCDSKKSLTFPNTGHFGGAMSGKATEGEKSKISLTHLQMLRAQNEMYFCVSKSPGNRRTNAAKLA